MSMKLLQGKLELPPTTLVRINMVAMTSILYQLIRIDKDTYPYLR